ncbi:hypothetical protein [Spelaeicoccus albus]|nr:hypothetical protein [Spelaeicoccus albus]
MAGAIVLGAGVVVAHPSGGERLQRFAEWWRVAAKSAISQPFATTR